MDMDLCGDEIVDDADNQMVSLQSICSESDTVYPDGSLIVTTSALEEAQYIEENHDRRQIHVESLHIPPLQIFQSTNKSVQESEDEDCNLKESSSSIGLIKEKQEPEEYFDDSEMSEEILKESDLNTTVEPQHLLDPVVSEKENNIIQPSLHSETHINQCTNCKVALSNEISNSNNFHQFLPLQYLDVSTGDYTDVQIVDALSEVFKIQWTCRNFGDIYKRSDLALCLECTSTLAQLYKLYNQFASLAIKSKSFLSAIINFQKELNLDEQDVISSEGDEYVANINNETSEDEETPPPAKWKRSRPIKKIQRYGNDENASFNESDSDNNKVSYSSSPRNKRKLKSSSDENNKSQTEQEALPCTSIPPKKRNKNIPLSQVDPQEEDGGTVFALTKFELDDSSFHDNNEDVNHIEDALEIEDNEPLQKLLKKLTTVPSSKDGVDQNSLKCKPCNKEFKFPIQYRIHMNSQYHREKVKHLKNNEENSKPKSRKLAKKGSNKDCKSKSCPDCDESFSKQKDLRRHIKSHRNKKIAGECDRCGKKFKTLGGLKIHYAAHVRDDNKYICKQCDKRFRKIEALELHEKTDHEGFKPHHCTQCPKTFRLKDKLKLHIMVIHENRKPFPCSKCEKSFRTKYHLKIHDVSQHIQGGDTSIGCSQCKRKFPDREALEKHAAVHEQEKPFICTSCNKGFHTSARLKLHEKSHQEVPSCLCPICGRAYKHIRDLRLHEVVHQDESTYRFGCGDCPRRFYRIDLLRVHQSNEKHFASEAIGPTVSKSQPTKDNSYFHVKDQAVDEDEEEDENETDSEIVLPAPKPKKKRKPQARSKAVQQQQPLRDREMTVMHPHATVIYHPSTVVQLHLDQSNVAPVSSANVNLSNTLSMNAHHQRQVHDVQAASTNYFINQRDRQNIAHHPGIQIQSVTSAAHPHIQFGNQTIYANPINMTSMNSTSEQIGYDIITSFINNLG